MRTFIFLVRFSGTIKYVICAVVDQHRASIPACPGERYKRLSVDSEREIPVIFSSVNIGICSSVDHECWVQVVDCGRNFPGIGNIEIVTPEYGMRKYPLEIVPEHAECTKNEHFFQWSNGCHHPSC
jgi:hypothetical protein